MDVTVIIVRFKETLAARGYSPATVTSYSQNISLFSRWLSAKGITDIKQITAKVIAEYRLKDRSTTRAVCPASRVKSDTMRVLRGWANSFHVLEIIHNRRLLGGRGKEL